MLKRYTLLLALYSTQFTITAQTQVTNGLIHHYPIIESPIFLDKVGTYHGVTNGTLTSAPDRYGDPLGAVAFDSSTFVEIPYAILPNTPISFTITGWIKPYQNVGEILNDRTDPLSYSYKYRIINYYPGPAAIEYNSYISCYYEGTGGCAYATSNVIPPINQWYFFAASFDIKSGYHRFYVNGSYVDSSLRPTTYSPFNNNTIIGMIQGPTKENPFVGAMDDIRFYNRTLTKAEMDTLYSGISTNVDITGVNNNIYTSFDRLGNSLTVLNLPHQNYEVSVIDASGRRIGISFINQLSNHLKISLPNIAEGIYYCQLIDKRTKQTVHMKFVV